MKIVIAPDSFKDSLSAIRVCDAIEKGVKKVLPDSDVVKLPMSDGGEGTVEALVSSTNGRIEWEMVRDPMGDEVKAHYGILGDGKTAVIEMASASGLPLVPPGKRNPLYTTTYGTGELILAALEKGCHEFIIGIGGSATNDLGTGMAQALGVVFYDKSGKKIEDYMNGDFLGKAGSIDFSGLLPAIKKIRFTVACDVKNPLLGPSGCAHVYARQKGATDEIVEKLESNMTYFVDILEKTIGRKVRDTEGAGAAGGLGAGLIAFVNGKLEKGIEIVLKASGFAERIKGASLILTGEGKIDYQTAFGKTLSGIAREARKQAIPVIGIGGIIADGIDILYEIGMSSFFSICDQPMDMETAMKKVEDLLPLISERIIRAVLVKLNQ